MSFEIFRLDNYIYVKNSKIAIEINYENIFIRKRLYFDQKEKLLKKQLSKKEEEKMLESLSRLKYVITQEDEIFKDRKYKFNYYRIYKQTKHLDESDFEEIERLIDEIFIFYKENNELTFKNFVPLAERDDRVTLIKKLMNDGNVSIYKMLPEDLKKEEELLLIYLKEYGTYSNTINIVEKYLTKEILLKATEESQLNAKLFMNFKELFKNILLKEEIILRKEY